MSSYGGLGPMVNGVLWLQIGIAAIFVGFRLYTRFVILHNAGWDDALTALSLLLLALFAAFTSVATYYGLGRKIDEINNMEHYVTAVMYEIIGQFFGILVVGTSKAAVATFLLRILTQRWHRMVAYFAIITTCTLSAFASVIIFIQCLPVERTWNPSADGVCWINFAAVGITTAGWSVVMDFLLAIFPCFVVWGLKMRRKEKLLVVSGLSLGVFAGVAGLVRTIKLTGLTGSEYLLDTVDLLIWSATEGLATIMCSSIPVMRPLYLQLRYGTNTEGSSGPRSYPMKDYDNNSNKSEGQSKVYSGATKDTFRAKVDTFPDNESEESILRGVRAPQPKQSTAHGIHRTDEISIHFSNKESESKV